MATAWRLFNGLLTLGPAATPARARVVCGMSEVSHATKEEGGAAPGVAIASSQGVEGNQGLLSEWTVSRVLFRARVAPGPAKIIHLGDALPRRSSALTRTLGIFRLDPIERVTSSTASLFELAPGGACLAAGHPAVARGLLPHDFTLACAFCWTARDEPQQMAGARRRPAIGGVISVALSLGSPRVGVTDFPALWSPELRMQVLVTGASGLVGTALRRALLDRGDSVVALSRTPADDTDGLRWVSWDGLAGAVDGSRAIVHLAGANIADKRWTPKRKAELRTSRVDSAQRIVDAIRVASQKPSVFITASAVGYYGTRGDETLSEDAAPGADFLAQLCQDWETVAQDSRVRTVALRTGVVLSRDGGALPKLLIPFRLGLGGPIGRGRQYLAWVHIDDVVGVILHAIDHEDVNGPLNVVGPESVTNAAFGKALGRALHRPAFLPTPPLIFKLRLGEGASILTDSQRAVPTRTQQFGYNFRFPTLDVALADILA